MDVTVSLAALREAGRKRPAFWAEATAAGKVEGDRLRLDLGAFQALNERHFGSMAPGNIAHRLAEPVAAVAGLEGCPGCADRQVRMNAATAWRK